MTGRHAARRRGYVRNPWTAVILHTLLGSVLIVGLWIYNPAPMFDLTPHAHLDAVTFPWVAPKGVPASYAGAVRQSLTGKGIAASWEIDPGRGGYCPPRPAGNQGNVTVTRQGWVQLHTTGKVSSCAEVRSPRTFTAGVFEFVFWTTGGMPDWPAIWMSGTPWPNMGEIDGFEHGWSVQPANCAYVTWHWNAYGPHGRYTPRETRAYCVPIATPKWHVLDMVRKPNGVVEVWYDGHLRWSYNTRLAPQPENLIADITADRGGRTANLMVASVRVWNFGGSR